MRHILTEYSAVVRAALAKATNPSERAQAIIAANFDASFFAPATVSAWMTFYAQAHDVLRAGPD